MSEQKTRNKLLEYANRVGAGKDLRDIFDKYDATLPTLNQKDRLRVSVIAIDEITRFMKYLNCEIELK